MLDQGDLQEVLQIAMSKGCDFADIFIEEKKTVGIGCEDNKIERINSGIDTGAGVRVVIGDKTAYAYTNDLTLEALSKVARVVSEAAQGKERDVHINFTEQKSAVDFEIIEMPDQVDISEKVDIVNRANKTARQIDEKIKQVSVGVADTIQNVIIANSDGDYVEDRRIRTRFMVNIVAAENSVIQTGFSSEGGFTGYEIFKCHRPEEIAKEAAGRALKMLEAKPAPAGKMEVVMAGDAGGTMVHEACGHGLEADLVQKKLSVYGSQMGQQVASELITVVDDATILGKYGSLRFDDEGTPGQKTVLIRNGILECYMHDRLTAKKDKTDPTGNGRRESYQDKPIPRMTNTYIAPGNDKPEEIIKSVKQGLLVKKMGGGQVNTTNGDFVFDVAEGYLIQDGQITTPVRGATLTGNGPEVLKKVDRVGTDLGYTIGTCGKDGQGAPVSDAQPTIHIPQIVVGGTAHGDDHGPQIKKIYRL